ncbi:MAG: DUF2336 domain-containing protein [Beijerinckiaceae bacterium]
MSAIQHAMDDLRDTFATKDAQSRAAAMEQISELFVMGAEGFSEAHVALFDQVISLLASAIETRARTRLSEKFADLPNAPPETMRKLSRDEIVVARPVLARSPRLTATDLIEAARHGGRDHMLAISERKDLPEPVTDVLVQEGDRVVVNAVASNPTARFSPKGYDALIARSKSDELLQSALGRRTDIPARHMAVLFELAKKAARERLMGEVGDQGRRAVSRAVNSSARDIATEAAARSEAYRTAIQEVSVMLQAGNLTETTLQDFARAGQFDHASCALASLAKLPLQMTDRALAGDADLLLIIGRACNLNWASVKALLMLARDGKPATRRVEQLADSYAKLALATAQRVLRFLHARENAGGQR